MLKGGAECYTNCGDADPTPIAGYSYYEYENCNAASQKQIFRGDVGYAWQPTVAYNGICWHNGVSTTTPSNLDIRGILVFTDCAFCLLFIGRPFLYTFAPQFSQEYFTLSPSHHTSIRKPIR